MSDDVRNDIWEVTGDFEFVRDYLKTAKLANMTRATTRKLFKKPIENVANKAVDYSLPKIQSFVESSDYNRAMVDGVLTKDASWKKETYRVKTKVTNKGAISTIAPQARSAPPLNPNDGFDYKYPNGGVYYIQTSSNSSDWNDDVRYRKFLTKDGKWVTTHSTHKDAHMINWSQIDYINSAKWVPEFYEDLYGELDKNGFSAVAEGLREAHSGDYPIPTIDDFIEVEVT